MPFPFIPFLLGLLLGFGIAWVMLRRGRRKAEKEVERMRGEMEELEQCGSGLAEFTERQRVKKEAAKERILAALEAEGELGNEALADRIGKSAATVVRYMNELEREGKVEQVGATGRSVRYRLNASGGG